MRSRATHLSVVIPVHNGMRTLPSCLASLGQSTYQDYECIVVNDASTDGSGEFAARWGARVLQTEARFGPAYARNEGAKVARGQVLVFLDADVAVKPDTLERFAARFEEDSAPDAVIGSYDDSPADAGLISSFKNLMHHFIHQHGRPAATTFWCGCGAVKTPVFFSHGGLDDAYPNPSIEDIEFGLRMFRAGRSIVLDPAIQGNHLKTWTLWNLVKTDVQFRGIPWTELILRSGYLPNDLNLRWPQRISVAAMGTLLALLAAAILLPMEARAVPIVMAGGMLVLIAALNLEFYRFLASRRGWRFAMAAFPLHLLYFAYSGFSFLAGVALYMMKGLKPPPKTRERDDSTLERCS